MLFVHVNRVSVGIYAGFSGRETQGAWGSSAGAIAKAYAGEVGPFDAVFYLICADLRRIVLRGPFPLDRLGPATSSKECGSASPEEYWRSKSNAQLRI